MLEHQSSQQNEQKLDIYGAIYKKKKNIYISFRILDIK